MSERKRLSYRLVNINTLSESQYMENEILLDYNNNDFIVIGNDKKIAYRLSDRIKEATEGLLTSEHTKSSNQHILATDKHSGFMGADDKILLKRLTEIVTNLVNDMGNVSSSCDVYGFADNGLINLSNNGNIDIVGELIVNSIKHVIIVENFKIHQRPHKDFINSYGTVGYRDDLVCLKIEDCKYIQKYYENVRYENNFNLFIDDVECSYDNVSHTYRKSDGTIIIPISIIRRRNSSYISIDNMMGKFSDANIEWNEVIDIARYYLTSVTVERLLEQSITRFKYNNLTNSYSINMYKSNLKPISFNKDLALVYLPLNATDKDEITGQSLGGKNMYIDSPYGKFLKKSASESNLISFEENYAFCLQFMVCNDTFGKLISILDNKTNSILEISQFGKNCIHINNIAYHLNNKKYHLVMIKRFENGSVAVIIDGEFAYTYANKIIDNDNNAYFLKIHSKEDCNLGQVLITKDLAHTQNIINNESTLIDDFINLLDGRILIPRTEIIKKDTMTTSNVSVAISNSKQDKIMPGDIMEVCFNNAIVDIKYHNPLRITHVDLFKNNTVTVADNDCKFRENDMVKIFDDVTNLEKTYRVLNVFKSKGNGYEPDTQSIELNTTENIKTGMYIAKADTGVPVHLEIDGIEANVNVIRNNKKIQIVFNQEYLLNSEFKLSFIENIEKYDIENDISSIEQVYFGDNHNTIKEINKLITLTTKNMDINYNGNKILTNEKTRPMLFIEDDIEVIIKTNIKDFIIADIDIDKLSKVVHPILSFKINTGNNSAFINDKRIATKGLTVKEFVIGKFNYDGSIIFNIKTSTQDKQGKLFLDDINLDIKILDFYNSAWENIFMIKNQYGQITDFLIGKGLDCLYLKSKEEINIFYSTSKNNIYDNFYVNQISSSKDDNYLVVDTNNIIKFKAESDNCIYNLAKNYIKGGKL